MIQSDLPLEMSVVSPQPHMMEQGTAAHVILVQAPAAEWSTTLVTICETAAGNSLRRMAVTTPEHIMYNHVINAVFPGESLQCSLWYERHKFQLGHAYPWDWV